MKLIQLFSIGLLAFANFAAADGVSLEMFKMKRELKTLMSAETAETFQKSAEAFIDVAKEAQSTMPNSLDGDKIRFEGYQQGMQVVINVVTQANQQAKEGKLAEAKQTIAQLEQLKKQYHAEYK